MAHHIWTMHLAQNLIADVDRRVAGEVFDILLHAREQPFVLGFQYVGLCHTFEVVGNLGCFWLCFEELIESLKVLNDILTINEGHIFEKFLTQLFEVSVDVLMEVHTDSFWLRHMGFEEQYPFAKLWQDGLQLPLEKLALGELAHKIELELVDIGVVVKNLLQLNW